MVSSPEIDHILDELYEVGRREGGMWNVGPDGGALLAWLARLLDGRRVLEIGTSNGVSTIWIARALEETGGELVTLEIEPEKVRMANENLNRAGLSGRVSIVEGPAVASLQTLGGEFDLVFIDADKPQYPDYLREARRLVHPGSIIVADNITSHRDETEPYRAAVEADGGLDSVELDVAGGFLMSRVVG